ncbi:MAG: glycosyltransferase family 4 protein [Verrucomicrobia bacterium]|nr:glycosyltransferase family 4 protein [Verrucomicrobiota bacterium]
MTKRLRIQIVLPFRGITGGNLVLVELANRLAARGHEVWMLFEHVDVPWWKPRGFTRVKLRDAGWKSWIDWFDLRVPVVRCHQLEDRYVPDADVILASYWLHIPKIAALSANKGRKLYYVQAYETDFNEDSETKVSVDATYRLPFRHIVVASWIGRLLWEKFAQPSVKVNPAIDYTNLPVPVGREFRNPPRCLMQHHTPAVKGVADGIRAFELAARDVPGMTLSLFGPHSGQFETPHRTLGRILPTQLGGLYREHDILIWPSHSEGFGVPPVEAMACQCAVATTDNGGSEEFAFHEGTALVSPSHDVESLAANIIRLAKDMELRRRLARTGCEWVRKHITWERTCDAVERCFHDDTLWKGPNSPVLPKDAVIRGQ